MPEPEPEPSEPVTPDAPPLRGAVLMHQDWRDLTFVHWAVEPERVAHLMPAGVRPDRLDGRTFVGLVPFRMVDAAPGRSGALPWLGSFLETNIRLYSVDATGRRGVVFLSLDCDRLPVVVGARAAFGVPYRWAAMAHRRHVVAGAEEHVYATRLRLRRRPVTSRVEVRVGAPREATELDHFVSARWGLHTTWAGRSLYVPNEHEAWPLHDADLVSLEGSLLGMAGFGDLAHRVPDHLAFSSGVHAEFGLPGATSRPRSG
ncbi:MAG: DUF2071 domain-containing protein [Nocardioides sp.]